MFEAGDPRSHGGAQKAHEKGGVTPAPQRSPEGPDLRPWVGWLLHAQHPALMLHAAAFVTLSSPPLLHGRHHLVSWPVWVEGGMRTSRSGCLSQVVSPC